MAEEKMKYEDIIKEAEEKAAARSPEEKERAKAVLANYTFMFLQWWDTLKEIEKRYNIDAVSIAREIRCQAFYKRAQNRAKDFQSHRLIDMWTTTPGPNTPPGAMKWFECNDERLHFWVLDCALLNALKEHGRTDEELKEMAQVFCNGGVDEFEPAGFNPNFECFSHPRCKMEGDDHCIFLLEDHGGPPASYHYEAVAKKYPYKYGK